MREILEGWASPRPCRRPSRALGAIRLGGHLLLKPLDPLMLGELPGPPSTHHLLRLLPAPASRHSAFVSLPSVPASLGPCQGEKQPHGHASPATHSRSLSCPSGGQSLVLPRLALPTCQMNGVIKFQRLLLTQIFYDLNTSEFGRFHSTSLLTPSVPQQMQIIKNRLCLGPVLRAGVQQQTDRQDSHPHVVAIPVGAKDNRRP